MVKMWEKTRQQKQTIFLCLEQILVVPIARFERQQVLKLERANFFSIFFWYNLEAMICVKDQNSTWMTAGKKKEKKNWKPFYKEKEICTPPNAGVRELTMLGRERRPRLHKTKTSITEIKSVQLRKNIIWKGFYSNNWPRVFLKSSTIFCNVKNMFLVGMRTATQRLVKWLFLKLVQVFSMKIHLKSDQSNFSVYRVFPWPSKTKIHSSL